MAKIERKPLVNTLKKDMETRASKKADRARAIIDKYEGGGEEPPKKKVSKELQSKLTVMIPQDHHDKLKLTALNRKKKIRELIIEYIDSL